ncbi:hypothetical protein FOB22_001972 [Saccharomyces cerevisiae]|nr:hypothetical protein FOB22_001972 [Saccharomyces cerevisiae]
MKIQAGQLGLDDNDVPGPLPDTDSKPSSQSQNDTPMFKLGNFESPVLKELSRRTTCNHLSILGCSHNTPTTYPLPRPAKWHRTKTHIPQTNLKNHPAYLFKGLETPLKARQREMAEEQTKLQSQSLHTKNVFGTLQRHSGISSTLVSANNDNNSPHTPVTRKGYIPSSKYAYMMNSQSPRGKI